MATKALYIKTIDADGNIQSFPLGGMPAELTSYTYSATRMGGAPSLSGTVNYPRCLDADWTHKEFVEYNGERYLVEQIPSSSKDNTTCVYKHSLELHSARFILDNVFFFDAVKNDTGDVYRSNMTSFTFGGTIVEFKDRLNASLDYCGIYDAEGKTGYCVVIDEGIDLETVKELSFDDKYVTEALQEIYNTFELAYYWVGRVCHIGWTENVLNTPLKYGQGNALLSVQKDNSNNVIIDAITGHGSSDNIDFYYPNNNAYGYAIFETENFDSSYVDNIDLGTVFKWKGAYNNPLNLCHHVNKEYYHAVHKDCTAQPDLCAVNFPLKQTVWDDDFEIEASAYKSIYEDSYFYAEFDWGKTSTNIGICFLFFEVDGKKVEGAIDFSKFSASIECVKAYSHRQSEIIEIWMETVHRTITYRQDYPVVEKTTYPKLSANYHFFFSDTLTADELRDGGIAGCFTTNGYLYKEKFAEKFPHVTAFYPDNYGGYENVPILSNGKVTLCVAVSLFATREINTEEEGTTRELDRIKVSFPNSLSTSIIYGLKPTNTYFIKSENPENIVALEESGITLQKTDGIPFKEFTYSFQDKGWVESEVESETPTAVINITGRTWITPVQYLMPSVYRKSLGAERFLYALDNTHLLPDSTSEYYTFINQYVNGNPHQASVTFEDIKPTIKDMTNEAGELFGEVADVAYDINDNDTTDSNGNYTHQYFYIKLHKFSGDGGFSLFDSALATASMTLDMIDCQGCPACSFPVRVVTTDNNKFYNCVNTDGNGNLVAIGGKDAEDYVLSESAAMADTRNQDTTKKEIWICVQKDASTLGIVMPNVAAGLKVKKGDKFVITGISLPRSYTLAAEKRLDAALVQNMKENNVEKFTFTIKFSRIFLAENPSFASKLNENARIFVEYNGVQHCLYVNDYTVKADGNILDEVTVTVAEELTTAKNSVLNRIDAIKGDVLDTVTKLFGYKSYLRDTLAQMTSFFIRKDTDDTAAGLITFEKGLKSVLEAWLLCGFSVGTDRIYGMDGSGDANVKGLQVSDNLTFGDYASGLTGFGGRITSEGRAELRSLTLWDFLEVPELRYNRVTVQIGNSWVAPGAGIIETVTPDYDSNGNLLDTGTITLHLEDGEAGAVAADDICQGIWHNTSGNETETTDDSKGNFTFAGFQTVYFRITAITETTHSSAFTYALRPVSDTWAKKMHPYPGMHFTCYGNFTNTERQSCRYSTLTYQRYLTGVNYWEFSKNMIAAQFGDLSNLSIHGLEMKGYSAYLNNIYMSGVIKQFEDLSSRMEIDQSLGGYLAPGETETVTVSIIDGYHRDRTSEYTFKVERDTGDSAADAVWNAKAEHISCGSQFEISFSDLHISESHSGISTLFYVTADDGKDTVTTTMEY